MATGAVNVSDSAAMPSTSTSGVGPFSFTDIFSSSFAVGEGISQTTTKRNSSDLAQMGEGSALTPTASVDAGSISPEMIAIAAAGGLALMLVVVLAARR